MLLLLALLSFLAPTGQALASPETTAGPAEAGSAAPEAMEAEPPPASPAPAEPGATPPVELHGQLELQLDDGHLNTRSQTDSVPPSMELPTVRQPPT